MKKVLAIALILLFIILLFERRYIYWGYQHLGAKVGLNLNEISSDKYVSWIKNQSEFPQNDVVSIFLNKPVNFKNSPVLATTVLGAASSQERWIEINLTEQRLYMKEGGRTVNSFLISSGKWAPTPTGEWPIWIKLRYTRMTGGSKALGTYYDLPNVPYTMYFYQGYGIHGAYWHNNFGHPMSHGCINMRPEEAGIIFNWASVGTKVQVHY